MDELDVERIDGHGFRDCALLLVAKHRPAPGCCASVTLNGQGLWITRPVDRHCGCLRYAPHGQCGVAWGGIMSVLEAVESFRRNTVPFRRQVTIRRDGEDFVVAFHPQNIVAFRHGEASELRRMCHSLRWEIVRDTMPEPDDIRSW